ncbi:hypothetical protein OUZ56_007001 [Daphnia magna]|uniref:Uncharacterized protein n=1 Tax=Daphnia magna TaxID=35525 RepID=A0ABQ9YXB2_9CRUS|nr:hypothetical protein OUZ56_007001 [Daphnia magna]
MVHCFPPKLSRVSRPVYPVSVNSFCIWDTFSSRKEKRINNKCLCSYIEKIAHFDISINDD